MISSIQDSFHYTLAELPDLIIKLIPLLQKHKVLALHGELGAGKTTFTAALCHYLNVRETPDSPTFSLVNQYAFEDQTGQEQIIYHTDWYRLRDEEEARMAGIEDMLGEQYAWCIVEWSENAPELLPDNTLHLYFQPDISPERRKLTVSRPATKS
ncbi:MAG TPA: tRNA (adenosine(37)-N6)-threonylcarbamoyltransferase complex ATPase subunit type 1 TsaE [Edaphocola sp.]|nr:tRNA (adenosine(37)-N6)-threonylcarbamoyltransferase complex ATPase subunit type 1 TsaE [Edaphocola sp.]